MISSAVVSSITNLKAVDKTLYAQIFVQGYYSAGDGGGGQYWYDSSDIASADNGGTIIVATDGGRWKLINQGMVSVKQFGAKGDGVTNDYVAIQAAINSGIRRISFPSARYSCLSTLNITNLGQTGVPLRLFGDATNYNDGVLTAGSVILSNPGAGKWIADLTGSQFIIIEDLMFVASGTNAATFGLLYARSTAVGFAQNNSLRRVIIKMATAGGSIAIGNNCAEQFVCDECWLEADIPYVTTLANEQGFVSTYATIANTTFSNTAQSFRMTTFAPLTSTSMVLTGLATAVFDNCIWIPVTGNAYQYGITLRSSAQAYKDCQNIRFTGQIESWVNAFRLEGNTRDITFDFSTSNISGSHILMIGGTNHYSPNIRTNPLNTTGVSTVSTNGSAVNIYGGNITVAPNLKLTDANILLQGTDVDGGNGNMSSNAFFLVNATSSYHARWSNSKTHASVTWNPGSVPYLAAVATAFSVTGAALGDKVDVISPYAEQGCIFRGSVDSAGVVKLVAANLTGTTVTFSAATFNVIIERPTF